MDLSIFKAKLAATAQQLAEAVHEADLAGAARSATLDRLRDAASGINELIRLCNGEAPPARRDCPACTRSVMAAATLCGYCWTRLTPASL